MNAAETFVMGLSAAYFFFSVGLGIRVLRRQGVPLGYQGDFTYGAPFLPSRGKEAPSAYVTYFMVACLNEAEVIGATVSGLVDPTGRSRIIVIDDGSDDRTAQIALEAGKGQVILISRCLPDARKGQGAALNSGFTRLVADVQANGHDPEHVVVCVMDADGRLSQGAMAEILPLFDDPYVGGVQLAVRIRNRAANFLLRFQDYQFWSQSAMTQFGRIRTDSVSLGGNGQFARLSALLEAGPRPWSSSLTEDLDLTVTLALRGWKTTSTPRAAVDQQGVETFSALLRQRTRWYQGHMMTARRVPEILSAPDIRHAASVEMTLYILVPWIFDLPWSVLYHLVLIEVALMLGGFDYSRMDPAGTAAYAVVCYVLGFWPALLTGIIARRRDPELGFWGAFKMGHAFVVTNYLSYVCVWRALWRIARGQHGWAKTARTSEPAATTEAAPPDASAQATQALESRI